MCDDYVQTGAGCWAGPERGGESGGAGEEQLVWGLPAAASSQRAPRTLSYPV